MLNLALLSGVLPGVCIDALFTSFSGSSLSRLRNNVRLC